MRCCTCNDQNESEEGVTDTLANRGYGGEGSIGRLYALPGASTRGPRVIDLSVSKETEQVDREVLVEVDGVSLLFNDMIECK